MKKYLGRVIGPLISIALFMAALWVLHLELGKFHYRQIVERIRDLGAYQVLAAVALTALNYWALTAYDALALRYIRRPLPYRKIAFASIVSYTFSNNINLSIFGTAALRYRIYSAWGLSVLEIAKIVAFCGLTFWLGVHAIAGLLFVICPLPIPPSIYVNVSTTRPLGVTLLVIVGCYLVWHFFGKRIIRLEKPAGSPVPSPGWRLFVTLLRWGLVGAATVAGLVLIIVAVDIPQVLSDHLTSTRPVGVVFLVVVLGYLIWNLVRKEPIRIHEWEFPLPSMKLMVLQVLIAGLDWMLVAGVLYVLLPSHQGLTLPAFFSIYLLALVAGLISHVPGGLGVFEIVFLALLPKEMLGANGLGEAVVGALVVYRAIYYLLPLVVGSIMLGAYELHQRREDVRLAARVAGRWVSLLVPNVFAFTTLLGGAILLFSAARPVDFERAAWLAQWVPQWVMELSHLFSALAGLGLLLMAYNLQRRLDAAYLWTVVLLPLGALFSVLKGFDYEESIVLGFIFLALLPCRRDFYRQAPILTGRLSPAWVAITTAFLFCTVWLAVFSHKHVQYANSLWWNFDLLDHQGDTARHFRALGDAARALRAGLGVSLVMAWYIFGKLSRPPLPEPTLPTSAELDLARSVVVASPAAYANLALAGDKSLLFNDRKNAFIMYAVEERSWVALGDPVGPPAEAAELAWTFRELVEAKGGSPVFYEAGTDDLVLYSELGLQPLVIGEEARVPLETVPEATLPVAAAPAELWRALDEFQKQGGTFEIVQPPSVEPLLGQLQAVADGWAARSQVGQKRFSSGSLDPDYLRQCAVAVLRSGGRMVAFATLALAADREELAVNLVRYLPEAPPEALDHLLASLVLWGREQGYRWLNLGLTPVENAAADHALAPLWAHLGVLFFRHGEHFRDFQSLRQYKAKFEPIWQPKYLLCPAGWALPHILVNVAALIAPPHEPPAK